MFRALAFALTAVAFTAATTQADVFIGTGTIQTGTNTTQANVDVNVINGDVTLGAQFLNNITSNAAGSNGTYRVVGSNLLSTYGLQGGGGVPATYNGLPVVAVFTAQAQVWN